MAEIIRRRVATVGVAIGAMLAMAVPPAHAQDDSAGGSIGGSIGGSVEINPPAAHRPRPQASRAAPRAEAQARPTHRAAARGGGFDGAWQVTASGNCSGAGSSQYTVTGGRIVGPYGGGRVSPSGAVSTVGSVAGLSVVSEGRLQGSSGQGIYHQSDGCSGPWVAMKL